MKKRITKIVPTITFILFYTIGIQIVIQSTLENYYIEIEEFDIANIERFYFIINLLVTTLSVIGVFLQSCLYKIFLTFFQFGKEISFQKNYEHLLKGSLPFVISAFILDIFNYDVLIFMNNPIFVFLNVLITNSIYMFFVQLDLNLRRIDMFIVGTIIIAFNLFFITIGSLISPL